MGKAIRCPECGESYRSLDRVEDLRDNDGVCMVCNAPIEVADWDRILASYEDEEDLDDVDDLEDVDDVEEEDDDPEEEEEAEEEEWEADDDLESDDEEDDDDDADDDDS